MKNQPTNIHPAQPDSADLKRQSGVPVTPSKHDQDRMDRLGEKLEALYKGEFRRPATLSRALDALERELAQVETPA